MDDPTLPELREVTKQQSLKSSLRSLVEKLASKKDAKLEVKIGNFIAKSEETFIQLQDLWQTSSLALNDFVPKYHYKFEPLITQQDFAKASRNLAFNKAVYFTTIDLYIAQSVNQRTGYRFGLDEKGNVLCEIRVKSFESTNIDIFDEQRQYRATVMVQGGDKQEQKNFYENSFELILHDENIDKINCVRFKQTLFANLGKLMEEYIYKIQQVDSRKKADFILEIRDALLDKNQPLKSNIIKAVSLIKAQSHYFKPFYEAECIFKYDSQYSVEEYTEICQDSIRKFYDDIKCVDSGPLEKSLRFAPQGGQRHDNSKGGSNNYKQNYQQNQNGGRPYLKQGEIGQKSSYQEQRQYQQWRRGKAQYRPGQEMSSKRAVERPQEGDGDDYLGSEIDYRDSLDKKYNDEKTLNYSKRNQGQQSQLQKKQIANNDSDDDFEELTQFLRRQQKHDQF